MEIAAAFCLGIQKPRQSALFQQTAAGLMRPSSGHFRPQRRLNPTTPRKRRFKKKSEKFRVREAAWMRGGDLLEGSNLQVYHW